MTRVVTRREALRRLGKTGAGALVARGVLQGQNSDIVVAGQPVEVVVTSVSPSTVRIAFLPTAGGAASLGAGDALVGADKWRRVASRRRTDSFGSIKAGNLVVRFTADPPTVHVETTSGQTIQRLTFNGTGEQLSFLLPKGPLLGLGEGGPQFDRKGSMDTMRSGQGGYQLRTHGGRVPIQWLVGTDGWAMFIHQPLGTFDFTGSEGRFTTPKLLPLDIFIVSSSDPATIMSEYARITGYAELPALWTFGYMQSHRTLGGPDEIMRIAKTFREKKLPCDTLIYLGTGFAPSGWNTRNTEFTWHPTNFPDPKATIRQLHDEHFRVVLHIVIEAEGRRLAGTVNGACGPAVPNELQASCYWPEHRAVFDAGIDGWWPDQGDGFDEPSRRNRHRMYWEGSQLWRPNERPFALHRNGAAGMQRYAAFLWSGDVQSTWETLRTHVPVAINTGLSGIPFWGTDIGGFIPTPELTGELYVRWFQFGTFCPLFRSHGRNWHLRLPWGWNTGNPGPQETANYTTDPRELHNPDVEPICKKYLELRYRLMPYTYTLARECHDTGMPMIRALWLHYPGDPAAAARGDQYLWGRDILVAPVTEKTATKRNVYLPRGAWFDFWTEQRAEGGREIERPVDLATMPLYVRAGSIQPRSPLKQYTGEVVDGPLTLVVYPGSDGAFTLYEDDGKTFDYRNGASTRIAMTWRDSERRLSIRFAPGSRMLPAARRSMEVRIAGQTSTRPFTFDGRPIDLRL